MPSLFARGKRLYAKIQDIDGVWQQIATGFHVDDREKAERWAADRDREIARARALKGGAPGPLTLAIYVASWLDRRHTKTVNDDRTRLELHVLPRIGHLALPDVRPRHCRDVILELRHEGKLAPRTIREIAGLMTTVFKSALIEELVATNPSIYERGVLPKKADKDPNWRHQAIYTREEVEQLLSDQRVPYDRRVFYALKFFTGRHSEVSGLTWSQYDPASKPLGALNLGETKSGVPRRIPVHPVLAKVLAQWKLSGWEDMHGDRPKAHDLICPTRNLTRRDANEAQRQLVYDLEKIGLRVKAGATRNRRGHDLRRTLITLARSDGAIDSLLRCVTHGPKQGDMLDVYSTPPWEDLCREIAKLKIELRDGVVIRLAAV